MGGCFSHTPHEGPDLPPIHVPWWGIELATLWLAGQHSIRWATPARARKDFRLKTIGTEIIEKEKDLWCFCQNKKRPINKEYWISLANCHHSIKNKF